MFNLTSELARIQFGFTITSHIIILAITNAVATCLTILEGLRLRKNNVVCETLYQSRSNIFAVNFGKGVVPGLVMAYQFRVSLPVRQP